MPYRVKFYNKNKLYNSIIVHNVFSPEAAIKWVSDYFKLYESYNKPRLEAEEV